MIDNTQTESPRPGEGLAPAPAIDPKLRFTKYFGAALIPGAFLLAYFTIWKPIEQLQQTGETHYYLKGVMLPPLLLYMGAAMLVTDMRDGQFKQVGADGKARLTKKGKWFVFGMVIVIALTFFAWNSYLHTFGASAF